MKTIREMYVVRDNYGYYYTEDGDISKKVSDAKTWRTFRGADDHASLWGSGLKTRQQNTVVKVQVTTTTTVKVTK